MPKNKKKFISKENAITFQLVHRSQQDPLAADEKAPQHVLKEYKGKKNSEEEHKYGIFFDDDYDYLQHLKTVSEPVKDGEQVAYKLNEKKKHPKSTEAKVLLPSSVFQSDFEEPVGLLNKAAPVQGLRLELDPDVVAAMDDDFDFENPDNILEDNFIELANQDGLNSSNESEDESYIGDLRSELSFGETKSKFTEYSMTSSVIRRNEQLTLLDNHFEKIFEKYDDNDIGCLPHEDIEGVGSIQNTFSPDELLRLTEDVNSKDDDDVDLDLKTKTLLAAAKQDCAEEEEDIVIVDDGMPKWDCESILSTYSNIYNHPAKISESKDSNKIKINKKTGIPVDIFESSRLTAQALAKLDGNEIQPGTKSIISYISELSIRPKNESSEDRKIRKRNLKEYRRERRIEKKANTLAFKNEKSVQEKILLNLKNNQRRIKLF